MVEPRFTVRDDGMIDIEVGDPGGALDEALNDAVTSRAPKGARHPGLSTYWIDRTERDLGLAIDNGDPRPFASGNVTYLRTDGHSVIAATEFDTDEENAESIDVAVFIGVLAAWRERVISAGGVSGREAAQLVDVPAPRPLGPAM